MKGYCYVTIAPPPSATDYKFFLSFAEYLFRIIAARRSLCYTHTVKKYPEACSRREYERVFYGIQNFVLLCFFAAEIATGRFQDKGRLRPNAAKPPYGRAARRLGQAPAFR